MILDFLRKSPQSLIKDVMIYISIIGWIYMIALIIKIAANIYVYKIGLKETIDKTEKRGVFFRMGKK